MSRRGTLTRQGIVEAAMATLDRGHERQFSMRGLAAELGVDPMALYHHHRNRHTLMQEVMVALMADCHVPRSEGDWRQDVRAICRGIRELAHRHPGTFRAYVIFEDWVPSEHRVHEALYAALLTAGFSKTSTVRAVRLLLSYAESFAVDEITGWLEPFNSHERDDLARGLAGGAYPAITALLDTIATPDADAEFCFGLDVLIAGLERARGAG
jgi:TetR/AcrR family tetracycline transcriptional repressor